MIEVSAVEALIAQGREDDAEKIVVLTEEKKEVQRRLAALEKTNAALISGDYEGQAAQLAQDKLEIERTKIRQAQLEAELAVKAERIKLRKEIVSALGIFAKTLAVMVPIGIGLYKVIMAAKSE